MKTKITKVIELGTINIESGKVQISDPCYNPDEWCSHTKEVKKGEYICKVLKKSDGWGDRNGEIIINHVSTPKKKATDLICCPTVDSGQCGFFDAEYYDKYHKKAFIDEDEEDKKWYRRIMDITLNDGNDNCGTIDGVGVLSESGWGDGMYDCYAGYNSKGEITALKLRFI